MANKKLNEQSEVITIVSSIVFRHDLSVGYCTGIIVDLYITEELK